MHDTHRRLRRQARPALVWGLGFFLAGHLVLGLYLHRDHPELCDPEFGLRLRQLQARMAEAPGRPLALAVGSSRFVFGLRPDAVAGSDADAPILFNFGMLGTGPVGERMVLHRIVEMGVRPQWVFVEMWAPFLPQAGFSNEETIVFRRDFYWADVPTISRLYHRRGEAVGRVFARTVAPALHYRDGLLCRLTPALVPPLLSSDTEFKDLLQSKLDGTGWVPFPSETTNPAALALHVERARRMTKPLFDDFHVSDISDKALHALLDECRDRGIRVAFVLMPEHGVLRQWYAPMQAALTAYLRRLDEDYHVPVIDARAWCGDDDIPDCCHLSPRGARAFSERFGREAYRPLFEGRPLSGDVLLHDAATP